MIRHVRQLLLFVFGLMQVQGCVEPFCASVSNVASPPTVVRIDFRDVRAMTAVNSNEWIIVTRSEMDAARVIWRWDSIRGLTRLHSLRMDHGEQDRILSRGGGRWWYSFTAVLDGRYGVYSITGDGDAAIEAPVLLLAATRGTDVWLPFDAQAFRGLYVSPDEGGAMSAILIEGNQVQRRWTFAAPPRQGTHPRSWAAVELEDGRVALLCPEPASDDRSPWRLILRVLGHGENAVAETVLREARTNIQATLATAKGKLAVAMRAEGVSVAVIEPDHPERADWKTLTPAGARAGIPSLVAADGRLVAAWTRLRDHEPAIVEVREIGHDGRPAYFGMTLGESSATDATARVYLAVVDGEAILAWNRGDVMTQRLPSSISGVTMLTYLQQLVCPVVRG